MSKEKTIYQLDNGTFTTVRSHFIRQEFKKGKSRSQIRDMLNDLGDKVVYGIVANATANMDNGTIAHSGRVFVKLPDGRTIPRLEYIRDQVINKKRTVSEVAKELEVHYDIVYAGVKGFSGVPKQHRGRIKIELPDGKLVFRADYVRKRWDEGATRRQIADEIECDYTIVHNILFRKKNK